MPDPGRAVANDDHEASLARAHRGALAGRATSQSRPWRCGEPHSAYCPAPAYLHTPQALTLTAWVAAPLVVDCGLALPVPARSSPADLLHWPALHPPGA